MINVLEHIKKHTYFMCLFFITQSIIAQEEVFSTPDSLNNKTYGYLFEKVRNNYTDTISSLIYAKTALNKAKEESNKANISYTLLLLSHYEKDKERRLELIKKSVEETKGVDSIHSILPRLRLGIYYYDHFEYEKALKEYLIVLNTTKNKNNSTVTSYEFSTLSSIAHLKRDIGKHEEALELYKKLLQNQNSKAVKDPYFITSAYKNLAESMRYNKKNDSASYYYNLIKEGNYETDLSIIDIATINQGINLYEIGVFKEAENLLSIANEKINLNKTNNKKYYILSEFYLGKINQQIYNDLNKSRNYFLKVDSLLTITNYTIPETREIYEFLIKDYKKQGNQAEQLKTINKLLRFDSIMSSRKIRTVNTLYSEFDTPQLLKSKEAIIKNLEHKTNALTIKSFYLIIFSFMFFILFIIQYNKRKKYKKRFKTIITELDTKKTKKPSYNNQSTALQLVNVIDKETIAIILQKLDSFEEKKEFLQNDLNVAIVAKKCGTNVKYLPKIIRAYKNKSFINYINNLRIEYILNELKQNSILQKYTIKSISEEAGFNTAESFATAFKKKTGIKPSYYIRNLRNK